MDSQLWEQVAKVAIAAVPAGTAALGIARGAGGLRNRLKHDVELLEKLPDESEAKEALLSSVARQIKRIERAEQDSSRDVPMLVLALVTAPLLGYLTLWLIQRGHWWTAILAVPTGVLGLVFVYGIFDSAENAPRGSTRRRLPD